jgi:hypothetical protein
MIQKSLSLVMAKILGVAICGLVLQRTLHSLDALRRRDLEHNPRPRQTNTRTRLRLAQSRIIAVRAARNPAVVINLRRISVSVHVWAVLKGQAPLKVCSPIHIYIRGYTSMYVCMHVCTLLTMSPRVLTCCRRSSERSSLAQLMLHIVQVSLLLSVLCQHCWPSSDSQTRTGQPPEMTTISASWTRLG